MKQIFIFILCLGSLIRPLYAWEYQIDEEKLLTPSVFDTHQLARHFEGYGLYSLSDLNLSKAGFPFDKALVSFDMKEAVLIKAGLKFPEEKEGELIFDQRLNLNVIHITFKGTPYLILGLDFEVEEFRKIVSPWVKRRTSFIDYILPSAYAESCEIPGIGNRNLHSTAASIGNDSILKKIGECGLNAVYGAGEQVKGTLDFFKKLINSPRQLWQETKESFVELKKFVQNINSELEEIFSSLGSMSLSDKLEMACQMSGHVFAMVAQSVIAGPASLARSLPLVVKKLKAVSGRVAQAMALKKKGLKLPDNNRIVKEVLACEK